MHRSLILLLSSIVLLSFLPKRKHPYDKAIDKIMGKTWFKYRVCRNDTCFSPDDSLFFSGAFDDFKNHYKGYNGKSLTCITPHAVTAYGKHIYLTCFDCIPLICFIDTPNNGVSFPIYAWGLGGERMADVSFISDSEFVINTQINWMKKTSTYYKIVNSIE